MAHPNFFIVGVVKGGTTSLYHYLSQHPDVFMSPIKEVNYFSCEDIDSRKFSKDYKHDVNVNLKTFLNSNMEQNIHIAHVENEEDYLKLFRNVTDQKAIGEASNSYLLYPSASREIKQKYPNAKIIMMLRNPIERAFSQYIMNLKQGKILNKDFLNEIQEDDKVENKGWGANHQYLFIGKYYQQVKRYLEIFDRKQVKIFFYDDYKKDAGRTVKLLFEFLEIDSTINVDTKTKYNEGGSPRFGKLNYFINQFGIISWAKRNLPRSMRTTFKRYFYSQKEMPVITPKERAWLIEYYKEDVLELSNLLNKDLSHWLK